jgi:hypothetical protein
LPSANRQAVAAVQGVDVVIAGQPMQAAALAPALGVGGGHGRRQHAGGRGTRAEQAGAPQQATPGHLGGR